MSSGIYSIDRIVFTIQIRMLIQFCISGDEPSHLRIVIPSSYMRQPGIAIVAVTTRCGEHVGIVAAAVLAT